VNTEQKQEHRWNVTYCV